MNVSMIATPQPSGSQSPGGPFDQLDTTDGAEQRRSRRGLPRRIRTWWDSVPMRARLVGILVVLLVAALATTGWTIQYVLRGYLVGQVDGRLTTSAHGLALVGKYGQGNSRVEFPTDYVVRYTFDDGSDNVDQGPMNTPTVPDLPQLTFEQAKATGPAPFTVGSTKFSGTPAEAGQATIATNTKWRVVVVPAMITKPDQDEGQKGSIALALPLTGVSAAVQQLRVLIVLFGLLMTGICALLGWLAIRGAFRPLTEVEETAAAIAAGDLSRRVPEHPASTEVGRLTSSLNGMLAQIESAFRSREASEQRTRRFAADASHELRTPLASIRGFAELYRQGAVREPQDVARTMSRIEDESRRMGALVEDLLLLARLDEQRPARTDPVDLAVLAGDATHDARGLAPDRRVRLEGLTGHGPASAVVIGDENRLRQVVANLVANAARHTPAGTPIEVAVGAEGNRAILEVRDHGPGLPPEHAAKIFERFYRIDASRARSQGGGTGLGLSIVTAVVTAHGGRVGVAPTPGGGATFRVELPLATVVVAEDVNDAD